LNPLISAALSSILRHALTGVAGYFVTKGVWSKDEASNYLMAVVAGILALGWALYSKYIAQAKLVTALVSPAGTTERDVEKMVDAGHAPSVTTMKDERPKVAP
jgi:pyrroline-5-carboxylate reductase